jgi:hypothetical protein
MRKLLFILFAAAYCVSCSKDKKEDGPDENSASVKIGGNTYSFTEVPDASANYYDEGNGSMQFLLKTKDGASSLKVNCVYLDDITTPFEALGSTGAPPPPAVTVVLTLNGVVYDNLIVDETPWMTMNFTSIENNVWTGVFNGYSNNDNGDRIDITDGKFKVSLVNR